MYFTAFIDNEWCLLVTVCHSGVACWAIQIFIDILVAPFGWWEGCNGDGELDRRNARRWMGGVGFYLKCR